MESLHWLDILSKYLGKLGPLFSLFHYLYYAMDVHFFILRYGYSDPTPPSTPKATEPAQTFSKPATTPSEPSNESSAGNDYSWQSDVEKYDRPRPRRSNPPPKPSLFNRLNFMKDKKQPVRRVQRQPVDPRRRVYKDRLAREADWDRLENARALFNFKAEMKCDLEFRKGQVIQIITKTETQEDWWEGKIEDRVGIFPANYVKMM